MVWLENSGHTVIYKFEILTTKEQSEKLDADTKRSSTI